MARKHFISPETYLDTERSAEVHSEYYDGEIFAMSGGTGPHSLIGASLIIAAGG